VGEHNSWHAFRNAFKSFPQIDVVFPKIPGASHTDRFGRFRRFGETGGRDEHMAPVDQRYADATENRAAWIGAFPMVVIAEYGDDPKATLESAKKFNSRFHGPWCLVNVIAGKNNQIAGKGVGGLDGFSDVVLTCERAVVGVRHMDHSKSMEILWEVSYPDAIAPNLETHRFNCSAVSYEAAAQ
jgi:hypothetical protein